MSNPFFDHPILNSPYVYPQRHWELDGDGQPTQKVKEQRRPASFVTPIPKPKLQGKKKATAAAPMLDLLDSKGLSTAEQQYDTTSYINEVRREVDKWRAIPDPAKWGVTPTTQRLLQHWRTHEFTQQRPFFCQIEAVETAIWLGEVAPNTTDGRRILAYLASANEGANPGLNRIALKLATGAGKTQVMAMLIAWQTINSVRQPGSRKFTKGFLLVAPGLTIRDRLRVLLPNDPDNYYLKREIVPADLMQDMQQARIVITNYHAFRLREKVELAKVSRAFLQGRGEAISTLETEGQMIQRVMGDLMGLKNILVLNDEAHHCYREKPVPETDETLKGEEKKEAQENNEAARLWISGLEAVNRQLGLQRIFDLSATPFFLAGSGYIEGTLFPWTVSDFSLMDAIECGIVKLPRVPVSDSISSTEAPIFRELWKHIGKDMPKKGAKAAGQLDPERLPPKLLSALEALYRHYEQTHEQWMQAGINIPPCFIVVCNNTSTSKLVYEYISGYERENSDGHKVVKNGHLALFRNYDDDNARLAVPRTLLIDSQQLESGEALDASFKEAAATEIEVFRQAVRERTGNALAADKLTDEDLLREVMNTVGKDGHLGAGIRCVVSVSMLTEGWDANNVTHVLGVRAFGTQLLCEQVIGRALRRQSYTLNEDGLFNPEYADVLGIPFDFTAKPVIAPPQQPRETIHVRAVPERESLEIQFPRVEGYRVELPQERLKAAFTPESKLVLNADMVGPAITQNSGIIGQAVNLDIKHLENVRLTTVAYHLTQKLLEQWREPNEPPPLHLFGQLKKITEEWLATYLHCQPGTFPAHLLYTILADEASNRIMAAVTRYHTQDQPIRAVLDAYNPIGSTRFVNFTTSKTLRWQTAPDKCHVNWAILDSTWEGKFCQIVEEHPRVHAYVKNQSMGFSVPYLSGNKVCQYIPDFIVRIDDGTGEHDLLNLIVEIKGQEDGNSDDKKSTMETYWVPGVNNLQTFGRWDFVQLTDLYSMEDDFGQATETTIKRVLEQAIQERVKGERQ